MQALPLPVPSLPPALARLVVAVEPGIGESVLADASVEAAVALLGPGSIVRPHSLGAGVMALVVSPSEGDEARLNDPAIAQAVEVRVSAILARRGHRGCGVAVESSGAAMTKAETVERFLERQLMFMSRDAVARAKVLAHRQTVAQILESQAIRTLFQPIVDARTGKVFAYEALSRGPKGHALEYPEALLAAAVGAGLGAEVDWEMRWLACIRAKQILPSSSDALLFVNAAPQSLWLDSRPGPDRWAPERAWPASRTVTEATERSPMENIPNLRITRDAARATGMRFALDDVGAGYSGLASMALLEPEFVKIDMGLVRHCHDDPSKQAVITALVHFVQRTGARLIAEGVETEQELAAVQDLGVDLVQGYLIGRPSSTGGTVDTRVFHRN